MMDRSVEQPLWALTTYFNPVHYRRRIYNYRQFRRSLAVPLVTVELVYGEEPELHDGDADVLVQLRSNCVLWQKERLLNVALAHVPDGVRYLAWLDCDIIFERGDWGERAAKALEEFPLIQPFSEIYDLGRDVLPGAVDTNVVRPETLSLACKMAMDPYREEDFKPSALAGRRGLGFGWAARRSLLEEHRFYDSMILGSGDGMMIYAAYGKLEEAIAMYRLGDRHAAHYLAWARPFYASVQRSVGYVDGRIFHLWHGDLKNRRYLQRHERLAQLGFDPCTDIVVDGQGCWEWRREHAELQEYVNAYFASRMEDGDNSG